MSLRIGRFTPIAAGTLAITLAAATAFVAFAYDGSQPGPEICATPATDVGGEAPFLAENDAAMKKMMSDMAVTPTGDLDADFVAMMVPHHQGASRAVAFPPGSSRLWKNRPYDTPEPR